MFCLLLFGVCLLFCVLELLRLYMKMQIVFEGVILFLVFGCCIGLD